MQKFYYYSCLFFILVMPLGNISFFDIGFQGTLTNLFIILISLKLVIDYLLFDNFRKFFKYRIFSNESKYLLFPISIILLFDISSVIYHGGLGFLADRIGTILLVIIFIIGIDSYEKLKKIPAFWIFASSYLALQNILSNVGLTPVIEGSRFHDPRNFYGLILPFNYAVGIPGAFGWHGMILISGFFFSLYFVKKNKFMGYLAGILCLSSIFIMQSRSTYLAFIISFIIYLLIISYKNKQHKKFILIFSPIIILVAFYMADIVSYIQYVWDGLVNVAYGNVDSRFLQFQLSIKAGFSNWFLGVGHDYLFDSLAGVVIHNSFLYQLSSIGLAGFLVYCYIYYKSIIISIKIILLKKHFENDPVLIISLFAMLIGMCIELSLFRVISGKEQWLIIYFIFLYSAPLLSTLKNRRELSFKKRRINTV